MDLGQENILLNARARRHYTPTIPGPISIKSVIRGEGRWKTSEGEFLVDTSNLLILNHHQEYSLTIDSPEPVETLCLFFRPDFIAEADLENPFPNSIPEFAERTHSGATALGRRLRNLHAQLPNHPEPLWIEAQLFLLAQELTALAFDESRRAASLTAVKTSTRDELFRRVARARAFLDTHFDGDVSVEQAARSACLSPHHFHRVFHRAFGVTPHRYVVDRRLARAAHLLRGTRMPVMDVCNAVGFESLGSFATLFKTRFGDPPGRFRN